jgi:hypothetical protein
MAFFADLSDFHQYVFSQFQAGAHRQFPKLDAFGSNIFCKISRIDIKPLLSNLGNAFDGVKTELTMSITGMGIVFQTVVFDEVAQKNICFFNAFFRAYGNSNDSTIAGLFNVCHYIFSTF